GGSFEAPALPTLRRRAAARGDRSWTCQSSAAALGRRADRQSRPAYGAGCVPDARQSRTRGRRGRAGRHAQCRARRQDGPPARPPRGPPDRGRSANTVATNAAISPIVASLQSFGVDAMRHAVLAVACAILFGSSAAYVEAQRAPAAVISDPTVDKRFLPSLVLSLSRATGSIWMPLFIWLAERGHMALLFFYMACPAMR